MEEVTLEVETTTSTLTRTAMVLTVLLVLPSLVAATHSSGRSNDYSVTGTETGFQIPEYDSSGEILTQFVAPFLLIALVLQMGLERALVFTLADDDNRNALQQMLDPDDGHSTIKRQSLILSLVITGMIVPTRFFQMINEVVAWVFGGSLYILFGAAFLVFLYKIVTDLIL